MATYENKNQSSNASDDEFEILPISNLNISAPSSELKETSELKKSPEKAFSELINTFNDEKHPDVFITSKNGIPVVLMTELTPEMEGAIAETVPMSTGLGVGKNYDMSCTSCRNRLPTLLRMRTMDGKAFFMPGPIDSYPNLFHSLWRASRSGTVSTVKVVKPSDFGLYSTGNFNHLSVNCSGNISEIKGNVQNTPIGVEMSIFEAREKIFHTYMPLINSFFTKNGVPGIHSSLNALISLLPKVTYGDKLLASAVWMSTYIPENYSQLNMCGKMKACVEALSDLYYCWDNATKGISLPQYHQASGNTISALEVATSVEGLTKLLQERLSPYNYQVKSAPPSEGNINNAIHQIGEFTVNVMTLPSAIAHGAVAVNHPVPNSAMSAFEAMRSPRNKPINGAAGFHIRANTDVKTLKTMKDLMENLPQNLYVQTSGQTPCFGVDFKGLKEGVYQTPFSWGFKVPDNNQFSFSTRIYTTRDFGGSNSWMKVLAILPMKTNYLFICEGLTPNQSCMGPCCHVSLLKPEYKNSCGAAFGMLGNTLKLDISGNGPFAIGVGVSLNPKSIVGPNGIITPDPNPAINGSITLRSGNTEFIIR
jgi:hypothetical protein